MVQPTTPVCPPCSHSSPPFQSRSKCLHIVYILVVSANLTLTTLSRAVTAVGSPVSYAFANIDPSDDTNGGQPGGNIRPAYLYDPRVLRLRSPNAGTATSANEVLPGPTLRFNPGLIDPLNPAWIDSRKPLVAEWETLDGKGRFFTVNVHFASKGGSSSLHGDARPPVNDVVDIRLAQANITAVSPPPLLSPASTFFCTHASCAAELHRPNPCPGPLRAYHRFRRFQRVRVCRAPTIL